MKEGYEAPPPALLLTVNMLVNIIHPSVRVVDDKNAAREATHRVADERQVRGLTLSRILHLFRPVLGQTPEGNGRSRVLTERRTLHTKVRVRRVLLSLRRRRGKRRCHYYELSEVGPTGKLFRVRVVHACFSFKKNILLSRCAWCYGYYNCYQCYYYYYYYVVLM